MVGIFESGFYEVDDKWAFTAIQPEQRMLSIDDTINRIELNVDDLNRAPEIAKEVENAAGTEATPPPPGWSRTTS